MSNFPKFIHYKCKKLGINVTYTYVNDNMYICEDLDYGGKFNIDFVHLVIPLNEESFKSHEEYGQCVRDAYIKENFTDQMNEIINE